MSSSDDTARVPAGVFESAAEARPERVTSASAGERKHVTVLFSDLAGYTALSERLDPEEVLEVTHRLLGEAARIVQAYGGHVEKLLGDAILAVFGVPQAHDDDAVRAVRAALEISVAADSLGAELEPTLRMRLSMHAGVSTGLVIAGTHNPLSGRESLVGDAVNVASRLASVAGSGEVVVSEETHRLASGQIEFESLGEVRVKGKAEPLEVYRAVAPRERMEHAESTRRSVMVGRDRELGVLVDAAQRMMRGERVLVTVRGEPGIGKSRLLTELRTQLADEVEWLEGASAEWESWTPYRPFADMIGRMCRARATDEPDVVRERVEELVAATLGPRPQTAAYVCALLGVEHHALPQVDPLAWHAGLQTAVREMLDGYCWAHASVLCFEDLHWADPSSVGLVESLLNDDAPALLVCCHRPGFEALPGRSNVVRLDLRDLSVRNCALLAESLMQDGSSKDVCAEGDQGDRLSAELAAYLVERSGGNPLFLSETVRALQEARVLVRDGQGWELSGEAEADVVPATLNGVVSARIDRLDDSARRLLQNASVVGQKFSRELFELVATDPLSIDRDLAALVDAGLLVEPADGQSGEIGFKHAIVHDAAYETLLRRDRAELHRAIVELIEDRWPERTAEMSETLGFHADRGELPGKAISYFAVAGERAVERYALHEAYALYARAIELADSMRHTAVTEETGDGAQALRLLLDQMYVLDYLGDFQGMQRALEARRDLVDATTDPRDAAMFFGWLGFAASMLERHREVASLMTRAQEFSEVSGDSVTLAHVAAWQALAAAQAGDLDHSIALARGAQSLVGDEGPGRYVHMIALNALSSAYFFKGDVAQEARVADTLLAQGRQGDRRREVSGRIAIGLAAQAAGDYDLAASRFRDALGIATEPFFVEYANFMLGVSLVMGGETAAADTVLAHVIEFSSTHGTRVFGMSSEGLSGLRAFAAGDLANGVARTQAAALQAAESGHRYRQAMHNCSLGRVFLQLAERQGKPDREFLKRNALFLVRNVPSAARRSERYLRDSIEIAEAIGALGVSGQAHQLLGRLFAATGKKAPARDEFRAALDRFETCSAYQYAADTREELAAIETGR